jgi:dihydroorotase-like cyclic amidohydrolase
VVKSTVTGLAAYDVEFSDIADYGALTLPKHAKLTAASAQTIVELTWKDLAVNEPPDLTLFDLAPPEDIPVVEVDAQGVPREAPVQP